MTTAIDLTKFTPNSIPFDELLDPSESEAIQQSFGSVERKWEWLRAAGRILRSSDTTRDLRIEVRSKLRQEFPWSTCLYASKDVALATLEHTLETLKTSGEEFHAWQAFDMREDLEGIMIVVSCISRDNAEWEQFERSLASGIDHLERLAKDLPWMTLLKRPLHRLSKEAADRLVAVCGRSNSDCWWIDLARKYRRY